MTSNRAVCLLSQMFLPCFDEDEKEALTIAINAIQDNYRQKEEIERLKKSLDNMTDALIKTDEACRKAEIEGAKKFVEEVKRWQQYSDDYGCYAVDIYSIDNTLKEMVGEHND